MLSPINKEMGRKPYITTKGIDGGYVNEMRRSTQSLKEPLSAPLQKRSRGAVIDEREVIDTIGLITQTVPPNACWGIAFDASGGIYVPIPYTTLDVLYLSPGSTTLVPLNQTARQWHQASVSPNGNAYCLDYGSGIYVRTGGTGNFTLLEAGAFISVACAANGDIYALKSDQLWKWDGYSFISQAQTTRGYVSLSCAPNGDVYVTVQGTGIIYVRPGGVGDFVAVEGTYPYCRAIACSPNGDVFHSRYENPYFEIYIRPGGAGPFVSYFDTTDRYIQSLAVSPGGVLFLSHSYYADYKISYLNLSANIQPPKNTITQTHVIPERTFEPRFKNLKPYANQNYDAMQRYGLPVDHTGKEQSPDPEQAPPVLVSHIDEVFRYVRSGSPVVVDIPTNGKDPVSGVEIYARVDGFASVAPNGTSVIFNPGASDAALLIVHTKSGQQCTVNLMAK